MGRRAGEGEEEEGQLSQLPCVLEEVVLCASIQAFGSSCQTGDFQPSKYLSKESDESETKCLAFGTAKRHYIITSIVFTRLTRLDH